MADSFDVVVVGAGISGASTAYHLLGEGVKRVLLVERGQAAAGGTGRSAAIVRQHYSTPLMGGLALKSIAKFKAMRQELGADGGYERTGYNFLVPPDAAEAALANLKMLQDAGVDTFRLSDAEIAEKLPWLNPEGVAAVIHEPEGGYADPVRTTEAYVAAFQRDGGAYRPRTPVRAILTDGGKATGVMLDDGPIAAGLVVNAAGPWARPLAATAGLDLPLRAVREQDTVWEARPGRPIPTTSVSNAVDAIYVRPLGDRRYVLGRGFPKDYEDVDPYNYKETADDAFVSVVQARAENRFPGLAGMRLIDSYTALYDVTPDWYPFVGPRRELAGYADASGGSGHGFKIGPALGEALAHWLAKGEVADDFARLSHDRVADNRLFQGAYGGNRG